MKGNGDTALLPRCAFDLLTLTCVPAYVRAEHNMYFEMNSAGPPCSLEEEKNALIQQHKGHECFTLKVK